MLFRSVPKRRVASIGARGSYTQANFDKAKDALLRWVAENGLTHDGEAYAVYWNGPFTPWFLKTFEVHTLLDYRGE